jgi:hypothetical protein
VTGPQGSAGTNGTNGTNGATGPTGVTGAQGAGFSAITTPGTNYILTANGSSTTSAIGQANLTFAANTGQLVLSNTNAGISPAYTITGGALSAISEYAVVACNAYYSALALAGDTVLRGTGRVILASGISGNAAANYVPGIVISNKSVGIGTNAPAYTLDVSGTARITGLTTMGNTLEMGTAASWVSGATHTLYGDTASVGTKYIQWAYNNTPGTTIADAASLNLASPNVGINCNAPGVTLDVNGNMRIYEATGTGTVSGTANTLVSVLSGRTTGSLTLRHGTAPGQSSIVFPSAANYTSDYGYITWLDDISNEVGKERGRLLIGTENDYTDQTYIDAVVLQAFGGYVGIGQIGPAYNLDVNGTARVTGATILGGTLNMCNNNICNVASILGQNNVDLNIYAQGTGALYLQSPGSSVVILGAGDALCYNTLSMTNHAIVNVTSIGASSTITASNVKATFGRTITSGTTVVSSFAAYNGDNDTGSCNLPQVEFQHYYGGGYTHYIGSRHTGATGAQTGNAIDFYLYSNASTVAGGSTAPNSGNVRMMSVTGAGVGIGTTTPSQKLDVAGIITNKAGGNGYINIHPDGGTQTGFLEFFRSATVGRISYLGYGGAATMDWSNTGSLRLFGANVGITAASVFFEPSFPLDVEGTARINSGFGSGTVEMLKIQQTAGGNATNVASISRIAFRAYTGGVINAIDSYQYSDSNFRGQLSFSTTTSGNTLTQAMIIDSNQRVGINTTSPAYTLDVSGTARVTGVTTLGSNLNMCNNNISNVSNLVGPSTGSQLYITSYDGQRLIYIDGTNIGINVPSGQLIVAAPIAGVVGSLGTTAGDSILKMSLYNSNGNNSYLRVIDYRESTGTSWFSAATRIRQRIDETDQAYLQFNGTSNAYGVSLATQDVANALVVKLDGKVGIGTWSPSYLLDVSGTIRTYGSANDVMGLFSPTYGNYVHIGAWDGTGATSKNLVLNQYGGRVGINTSGPAYTLDVSGTSRIGNAIIGASTSYGADWAMFTHQALGISGLGTYALMQNASGSETLLNAASGGMINFRINNGVNNAISVMHMTSAGLSIGQADTDPSYKLDVSGTARATTGVIGGSMVMKTWVANGDYASLGHSSVIGTNTSYAVLQANTGETYLNSADGYALHLRTGGSDRVWIRSDGLLGINTQSPQSTTHIQGRASDITGGYGALLVDYPNAGGQGASVTIRNSGGGTGAFAALAFEVDGSTAIGTGSTPLVANQANAYIYCRNAGAGAGNDAATMGFQLWSGAAENEVMTLVGSNQRVGINTTSPSYQLDVNGDIRAQYILWACNVRSTFGRTITSATAVVSPFAAYNGDVNSGNLNLAQIEFQHYNGGGYTHYIGSRHEGGAGAYAGNAIDFYLYSNAGGAGGSTAPNSGNVRMMSVTAAGVGINNAAPAYKLDVSGTARITGVTTLKDKLDMSGNNISNVNTITGTAGYIAVDPLITGNGNTFTRLFGSYYTPSPYNSDFFITNNLATLTSNSSNILTATYDYAAGTSAIRLQSPYAAAGGICFYAGNSSSVPVNVMTVVPTGVGINCNAPSWPMDVSGVVGIVTDGTGQLILNSTFAGKSVIVRNDGGNFYLLIGSSHTSSWNSLRPFAFNLTNGNVRMEHTLSVLSSIDLCNTNLTNVCNVNGPGGASTLQMSNNYDVNIKAGNNLYIEAAGTNYVGFYQGSGGYVRLNPDTDLDILSRYTNLTNRALYLSHPGSNTGTNGAALQIFNTSASGSIVTPTSRYGNVWISANAGSGESGSAISLDVGGYGGNIFGGIKQGYYGFLSFGTINDAAVNTERMRIIGTTGFVGINTPTPATTLDVSGGLTVRNGIRPLFSNTRASSITTDATSYGTYYYMTATVSTITIGAPASTADSNAFWLFRNATSSYQNIVVTWPTISSTAPSPSTDTFVIPPMNSMSIMYTPANGDYGSYSGVFNWAVF